MQKLKRFGLMVAGVVCAAGSAMAEGPIDLTTAATTATTGVNSAITVGLPIFGILAAAGLAIKAFRRVAK